MTTSAAEQLDHAAKTHAAALAERTRLETVWARVDREHAVAGEAVDRELRAQAEEIQRSLHDETVAVREVSTSARDVAARKLAACRDLLASARSAEADAAQALAKAETAYAIAVSHERAGALAQHVLAHKDVLSLLALQAVDEVRAAWPEAPYGCTVHRTMEGELLVKLRVGAFPVATAASALANAISPRQHPQAASHLRSKVESEQAAREKERELRRTEISANEQRALESLDTEYTRRAASTHAAGRVALEAKRLIEAQRIRADYTAQRAAV